MIKMAVIHPSRWRAELAHKAFLEWVGNAGNPKELEYLLTMDDNDETIPDYQRLFTEEDKQRVGRFELLIQPTRNIPSALNMAAKQMSPTTEMFAIASDDVGAPLNWDVELFKLVVGINNFETPKFIGVSDGLQPFGTFFSYMANRAYYNKLGFIFYPEYDGFFADNDNAQVATRLNAIIPASHLVFEHRHYSTGKTPHDRTYAKHNNSESGDKNIAIYNARVARGFDLN